MTTFLKLKFILVVCKVFWNGKMIKDGGIDTDAFAFDKRKV